MKYVERYSVLKHFNTIIRIVLNLVTFKNIIDKQLPLKELKR